MHWTRQSSGIESLCRLGREKRAPGPIITGPNGRVHGVWVPAFAGTTTEGWPPSIIRRPRRRPAALHFDGLDHLFHHAAERHAQARDVGLLEHDGHVLLGPWHWLLLRPRRQRPVGGARFKQGRTQRLAVDAELLAELEALFVRRNAGPQDQVVDHLADLAGAERAEVKHRVGKGRERRPASIERRLVAAAHDQELALDRGAFASAERDVE